ncbi:MAG: acylpyruvate hydrolase [Solirubrobacterales bacterium]|jgi:2-keto-4-pentenoate hydratase/2-oxohepta-3-ene-1,7-dioic acid hydratase in catechol pathway|nr:acylpyruvate hydrolase [Solirubrobacterales bacterium]
MRLATYANETTSLSCVVTENGVVDVLDAIEATGREGPSRQGCCTAREVLALGRDVLKEVGEAAARLAEAGESVVDTDALSLGPPVPAPEKFICVGTNYADHAEEAGMQPPSSPVLFAKFANSLVGSGSPIELLHLSDQIDYEGELGVVIGARAKHVALENALDVVAGYTIVNDVSARDLQLRESQWLPGKAIDSFAPCGPWIVTADEIEDPQSLTIETVLNGELVQRASTSLMIFSVAQLVSFASGFMTLSPGDIISTGTPAGVGFVRNPPLYLRAGDEVEVRIEPIGSLVNPVIAPAESKATVAVGEKE